jgi:RNA-directed DNA polymerase
LGKTSWKRPPDTPIKARLIKEQNGRCRICGNYFYPVDIIERDHIIPKAMGGKNLKENAVHFYCHLKKTAMETSDIIRYKKETS